ncbi:uncharacterized protein [Diabrotica undecimpunctata]|uniref:uncharacterized protein n=1 Tax=Diabrotica undecimpunctata TaxID=50387 RepID=UPI003B6337DF
MADIATAKIKRSSIKGYVTRFSTHFNSIKNKPLEQINFRDLQLRLDRIEKLFDDFDNAQLLIEASDEDYTANADTIHGIERSSFETSFFHITSAVRDFIDTNLSKPRDQAAQASNSTISSENSSQRSINIRLPTINLPSFESDYDNWLFFRDTFNSIIHTNTELSNIQKFHYLRLSLQGIAAETIRNLDISEATYETAWELLKDRFENKSLLVNNHIKKLFNLPHVSKNSHHDLRTLLDGFQRHLRSLESLGLDTTSWDALIIYLITTKLDNATHKEWELSIKDDKITLPTLSNLTEFLKGNSQKLIETSNQTSSSLPCSSSGTSEGSNALAARNISFEHNSTTLLSTVKIRVFDISGNEYEARALLDNGSEILPEIAGNLPSVTFDKKTLNIPSNITLADPDFNISSPINILIGADIFWNLICTGQIKLSSGQPILQKTKLGWIISGPLFPTNTLAARTACHLSTINNLSIEDQLQKFWEIEECPKTKLLSNEELSCKDHFLKTTSLDSSDSGVSLNDILMVGPNLQDDLLQDFPDISSIILRDFYVDDLHTGGSTIEDIKRIQSLTFELLSRHGFQLRKWMSNAPILNFDNQNNVFLEIGADDTIKTLGLLWSPKSDTFHFNVQPIEHKGWIKTSPSLLKSFLANRVSQIQTLTESQTWRYVNTLENPADLLSRGISPTSLITSEMWFHGPSWLAKPETHWPNRTFEPSQLPELRPASALIARVHMKLDIITKISSFVKLQRIIAYVLRFINNCKFSPKRRNFDNLSCDEIDNALKYIIRLVQNETFYDDLTHLKRHGNVYSKSKLLTPNPFIDKDNILSVGGRLHNFDFCYDKKHPIVLDSKHHFTTILVRNEHLTLNHCGPQLLLASIREKFWPINGRQVVRKIVRDCIICCRVAPKLETYLMGNLPSSRLVPYRPFYNCGLDYAGPFLLKDRHTRNYKTIKGYIALFICLATKAIH